MIRARPVVIAIVTLMALSFTWNLITLWWEPSARENRPTSYSARAGGYRALYETLQRLDTPVERSLRPPVELFEGDRRVLLLDAPPLAVEREKGIVDQMAEWVRSGGEVVFASDRIGVELRDFLPPGTPPSALPDNEDRPEPLRILLRSDLTDSLGIGDLKVEGPDFEVYSEADEFAIGETLSHTRVRAVEAESEYVITDATGPFAAITEDIESIYLARGTLRVLSGDAIDNAVGLLYVRRAKKDDGGGEIIAAAFDVGDGQAVFVSEPILFTNEGLRAGDNAAIAYRIARGDGTKLVSIDEYYKGSLVTGNPSVLFTLYPYGIVLGAAALLTGLWTWSQVIRFGPPLKDAPPPRRSIVEYVDAMGRLYRRGSKTRFALDACRKGLIEDLRHALFLPAGTQENVVLSRVDRLAPDDAPRLRETLAQVNQAMQSDPPINERSLYELQEHLESCRIIMNRLPHREM